MEDCSSPRRIGGRFSAWRDVGPNALACSGEIMRVIEFFDSARGSLRRFHFSLTRYRSGDNFLLEEQTGARDVGLRGWGGYLTDRSNLTWVMPA